MHARSLADEDVDVPQSVHDGLETGAFLDDVDGHLGDPDGVDVAGILGGGEACIGDKVGGGGFGEAGMVDSGGFGGEGSGVAAHAFVDDEHAGVGGGFGYDVFEEDGSSVDCRLYCNCLV